MTVSDISKSAQKTVLVVSSDVAVLLLMRGILQNDCRVLLAADSESAIRLTKIDGVRIDLAMVDRNVRGSGKVGLRRRLTEILPQMRILSMAGLVQDGVIRLQSLGSSTAWISENLLQDIRIALAGDEAGRKVLSPGGVDVSSGAQTTPAVVIPLATKVMVAGGT